MKLKCLAIARAAIGEPTGRSGQELLYRCSNHHDEHPSLAINPSKNCWMCGPCGKGGNAWELAAFLIGCDPNDRQTITNWLREKSLLRNGGKSTGKVVATYDYRDESGALLFQVLRYAPKAFRQRRPDRKGNWIWNLDQTRRVLYNLPEVLKAGEVLIPEGERDCETAKRLEFVATCNPSGARKWRNEYSEFLKEKHVVVIADADEAGRDHAQQVAASLAGKAESVKVLELPGAKDLTDWIERGGTKDELLRLIDDTREWEPTEKAEREGAEGRKPKLAVQGSGRESQATALAKLIERMIESRDIDLFHTPGGKPFARTRVNDHWENWPLKSTGFETWLARLSFEATGKAPSRETVKAALAVLTGRALFGAEEVPAYVRVAERDGNIYVDLCDASWRAVQITPAGWRVVSDPPVRFRRARGMLPLPEPVTGGAAQELLKFVNIKKRASQVLFLSWVVAALRPHGPYPILALHGGQGSAKTTCGAVGRKLIDPSEVPLRTGPRDERDLMIAANNGHIIGYDNISSIPPWLSDAVCRVASGGGLGTRQLYTDEEETIFSVQRPIMFNGIEELASRGDLLDRMLIIHLPPIPESERYSEAQFWQAFEEARPRIFGALLTVVAAALKRVPSVKLATLPRMADFAIWSVAAELALGFRPGEFMAAYTDNRCEANLVALEFSAVAFEIVTLVNGAEGSWHGTAGELLTELTNRAPEEIRRERSWPKTAKAMSNALARVSPNLSAMGIIVERLPREPGTGRRPYKVCKTPSRPSQPQESKPGSSDRSDVCDGQKPPSSHGGPQTPFEGEV